MSTPSSLQTYLASKYLSGAKADAILARSDSELGGKRRKKKRKVDDYSASGSASTSGGGLIIEDDDGGWAKVKEDEEDEYSAPVISDKRGDFKASSSNSWSTVRPSDPSLLPTSIARTPSPEPDDELPAIVPTIAPARGGLQSSADLRRENERREHEIAAKKKQADRELKKRRKEMKDRGEVEEDAQETVYRDSSGRKIDLKLEKAEKAKNERARLEAEMKKMEWGKGEVQKVDQAAKRRELEEMKNRPISRYADDQAMNDEMKEVDRWNDPAAAFLTKKFATKSAAPRYPKYTGPSPPPNRFGIPPGYRWDGVARGNGWEAKRMQRGNSLKMRAAEAHAYSTEEM